MKKLIEKNLNLKNLSRIRISENRNLVDGLRLNRNERVDVWPDHLLENIFNSKPSWFLSIYPDLTTIYQKISDHINIDVSKILITSGIDGAIKTIWEVATEPGEMVCVPGPTYAMYYVYSKIYQTNLVEIQYEHDTRTLNWSHLNELIEQKPAILFIPNPNQPIEDTLNIKQIIEIAEKTEKNQTLLVLDEAYYLFGADTAMQLIDQYDNLVIMRTFSKGFGVPAIRLGYMVTNQKNMDIFSKTRFAHETNALSVAVAEYLLDNFDIIKAYNKKVVESREIVKNELKKMGISSYGENANYLLIDLFSPTNCKDVVRLLEKRNIYVKGNWQHPWDKYILATIGPIKLMDNFLLALKKQIKRC